MKRPMKIIILGLSLSSAWGNGHATTYRALVRSLVARGNDVLFLERDVPWYAAHRDLKDDALCQFDFYSDLEDLYRWRAEISSADAVIVGSFVPDGIKVADWVLRKARGTVAFYDIDTPVTLSALADGTCEYLAPQQVGRYDIYFSFTGGPTLDVLKSKWGAKTSHALYCSVDAEVYRPQKSKQRWDLGYLGTYSADRQPGVERFVIDVATQLPERRFVVAGAQYPDGINWPSNVERIEHVPPSEHVAFYTSLGWALNLTRADMRKAGYSPSVRLFEAAACGTPIISDDWPGIETLLAPGAEIVIAHDTGDVITALKMTSAKRAKIAATGRHRVLAEHTSDRRAAGLEAALKAVGGALNREKTRGETTSMDYV
jgi:spore maturation protein CgeB